jgi:hypothetical protein
MPIGSPPSALDGCKMVGKIDALCMQWTSGRSPLKHNDLVGRASRQVKVRFA